MRSVFGKFTCYDRIAHILHKSVHEVEVVVCAEHEAENLALLMQMPDIAQ